MIRETVHVLAVIGVLCFVVYFLARGETLIADVPPASKIGDVTRLSTESTALCGPPSGSKFPVVVEMLYSNDKRPWVEYAADRFARVCPNIQVKLMTMSDLEAVRALVRGEAKPTLWAPSDELFVDYLADHVRAQAREPLFDEGDRTPLVSSPLVLLLWKDRASVLEEVRHYRGGDEGTGMEVVCAQVPREPGLAEPAIEGMVPGRWSDWVGSLAAPGRPAGPRGRW